MMSQLPPSKVTPNITKRPGRQFKELDPHDPVDNAFVMVSISHQFFVPFFSKKNNPLTGHRIVSFAAPSPKVTQFNIPPSDAWRMSRAVGDMSGFYARLRRWREKTKSEECAHGLVLLSSSDGTPSSLSSASARASDSQSISVATKDTQDERTKKRRQDTMTELLPLWMDTDKTIEHYYQTRYKQAFKAATLKYQQEGSKDNFQGKKGTGIRAIVNKANNEMLASPNDMKLTRAAVHAAILRGEFGVSPPKRGRKPVVNPTLTFALATHSTMMQVSGEGEASAIKMKAVASALMSGTTHEGSVSIDYLWRKTRLSHPEIMNPVKAKNHEDRRVDWLTYKNIFDWNLRAKQFLVDLGMANDEPGMIRMLLGEVSVPFLY